MSKPTRATTYIHQSFNRMKNAGVSIDWDESFQTVSIDHPDEKSIFMQGSEAQDYIDQINALCKRYRSLDEYTAALYLAEQYVDCIWE